MGRRRIKKGGEGGGGGSLASEEGRRGDVSKAKRSPSHVQKFKLNVS